MLPTWKTTPEALQEKIVEALSQLIEAYAELQEQLETEYGSASTDDDDAADTDINEVSAEVDAAMIAELKAAMETVIDTEDFSPEEFARFLENEVRRWNKVVKDNKISAQ